VDLVADFAEETATVFRPHRYRFADTDVILAEGIYHFKAAHRPVFDVAVWIDGTFETALERAIARSQEGLAPVATVQA
jgi:uridine kinase